VPYLEEEEEEEESHVPPRLVSARVRWISHNSRFLIRTEVSMRISSGLPKKRISLPFC